MLIPENFAQVNHWFSGSGVPTGAQVTYGVFHATAVGSANEFAERAHGAWADNVMPQLSASTALVKTSIKLGPNTTGASGEFTDLTDGSLSSVQSPPNVTLLVTKTTMVGGRQGKGRMFVPGLYEGGVDQSGNIADTYLEDIQSAFTDFLAALDGLSLYMALLRAESSPISTPTDVTGLVVAPKAATQRRRLRR